MARNRKGRVAVVDPTKPDVHTRVDRWIKNAKNHPAMAVFVFLGIVMIALSTITDSAKRLNELWAGWRYSEDRVLIYPIGGLQPPFEVEPAIHIRTLDNPKGGTGPDLNISWVLLLSITNVSAHPIIIKDLDVGFNPVPDSGGWRLVRLRQQPLSSHVEDTEEAYRDKPEEVSFQDGPLVIPPSSRRYYAFQLLFDLYQGDRKTILTDVTEAKRAVLLAVGGDIDDHGVCRVVMGPANLTFSLANGTVTEADIKTTLDVPGCYVTLPAIVK